MLNAASLQATTATLAAAPAPTAGLTANPTDAKATVSASATAAAATSTTTAATAASPVAAASTSNAYVAYTLPCGGAPVRPKRKVSIVGAGAVGCAIASSILGQRLCTDLVLIDVDVPKVKAEVLDFQHGMGASHMPVTVTGGNDLALTAHSNLVAVCAGVRQRPGESRRDLLNRNAKLLVPVIRDIAKYSPDCVLLMVTNPNDAMTWLAYHVSGFPASRVIGSGTTLDSSRFRLLLAEKLNLPITAVHAHTIGEHGDASLSIFSSVNVFGTPLRTLFPLAGKPNDPDHFHELGKRVVGAAQELIAAKGYTSWGIGLCGAAIARAILSGEPAVLAVSTLIPPGHKLCTSGNGSASADTKNFAVSREVAMSMPCELGVGGAKSVLKVSLDDTETASLQACVNKLIELQDLIDLKALGVTPNTSGCITAAAPAASKL